jgi:uncharacterized protein (DUF302 family)
MVAFRKSFSSAQSLEEMEQVVNPVTQPNGLMEFARFDLGDVLRKENGTAKPRILRIVAGNPLIMKEMVKHVVDAGSYAPITILIEERTDGVRISYDRMASYLAPYGSSDAIKVAQGLDAKVERVLTEAHSRFCCLRQWPPLLSTIQARGSEYDHAALASISQSSQSASSSRSVRNQHRHPCLFAGHSRLEHRPGARGICSWVWAKRSLSISVHRAFPELPLLDTRFGNSALIEI